MRSPTTEREVLNLIGRGWKLRVNKAKTEASLVDNWKDKTVIACDLALALGMIPNLRKLPATSVGYIVGLDELGLDSVNYDWYCMIQ
jgi:hypothetical protein